ncbi:unnamed protein product [Leuciscus chuanchicus]
MNRLAIFQLFDISKTGGLNLSPLEPIQSSVFLLPWIPVSNIIISSAPTKIRDITIFIFSNHRGRLDCYIPHPLWLLLSTTFAIISFTLFVFHHCTHRCLESVFSDTSKIPEYTSFRQREN